MGCLGKLLVSRQEGRHVPYSSNGNKLKGGSWLRFYGNLDRKILGSIPTIFPYIKGARCQGGGQGLGSAPSIRGEKPLKYIFDSCVAPFPFAGCVFRLRSWLNFCFVLKLWLFMCATNSLLVNAWSEMSLFVYRNHDFEKIDLVKVIIFSSEIDLGSLLLKSVSPKNICSVICT